MPARRSTHALPLASIGAPACTPAHRTATRTAVARPLLGTSLAFALLALPPGPTRAAPADPRPADVPPVRALSGSFGPVRDAPELPQAIPAAPRAPLSDPTPDAARSASGDVVAGMLRIRAIDTGRSDLDLEIVEVRREPRVSVLRVRGLHARSTAGSRWLMCMFNTIAVLRGFDHWTAVYPEAPSEDVLLGFPSGPSDRMAAIDPRFGTRWALGVTAPIERGIRLCRRDAVER